MEVDMATAFAPGKVCTVVSIAAACCLQCVHVQTQHTIDVLVLFSFLFFSFCRQSC